MMLTSRPGKPRGYQCGASLIEALVALLVLALVFESAVLLLSGVQRTSQARVQARVLWEQQREQSLRQLLFSEVTQTDASRGSTRPTPAP